MLPCLPHPSVIRDWFSSVDGEPGFTQDAFNVLRVFRKQKLEVGKDTLVNLTFDEMAIRKHVEWDGSRYRGFVDIGTGLNDDTLPPATEALVFMIVAIDGSWKLPCGSFLLLV